MDNAMSSYMVYNIHKYVYLIQIPAQELLHMAVDMGTGGMPGQDNLLVAPDMHQH